MADEVLISRAILKSYMEELSDYLEVDAAVVGAGPAGMTAAYFIAKAARKVAVIERKLCVGGGMPGGGMMFNKIVVEEEGREILEEFGVRLRKFEDLYVADAIEAASALCLGAVRAGAKIFNLLSVEDVVMGEGGEVRGLVINWSAASLSGLHVDPLAMKSKVVVDATGHESEICRIITRKMGPKLRTPSGEVRGEGPMRAEEGERAVVEYTQEIYPGLIVAGMAASAAFGLPRMGPIFGGMLLSGKKAAEIALRRLEGRC